MSKYCEQGTKTRDLGGVKAPRQGENEKVIREAEGKTVGIVGMKGIGKGGLPIKGGK